MDVLCSSLSVNLERVWVGGMGFGAGAPTIVSEVIEGEAIIIDLLSGDYFSTQALGAILWSAALSGQDRHALISGATAAYVGADGVETDVDAFLTTLVGHGLLVENAANGAAAGGNEPVWPPGPYAPPVLHQHSDMQDLVMLDPIHEVDTVGWPTRREDTVPLQDG